jgi:hypothetical protein
MLLNYFTMYIDSLVYLGDVKSIHIRMYVCTRLYMIGYDGFGCVSSIWVLLGWVGSHNHPSY